MSNQTEPEPRQGYVHDQVTPQESEKQDFSVEKHEHAVDSHGNLIYENSEEEPELHARTYLALAAMFLLNYVQVVALMGPPAVV